MSSETAATAIDVPRGRVMNVGIIGTGGIGGALARHFSRTGVKLLISNSRGPESLIELAGELGGTTRAVSARDAAQADVVFVAVPWANVPAALAGLAPWGGRIVVDATNPILGPDMKIADLGGRTSSEIIRDLVPGARLVKAANTLLAATLGSDASAGGGKRVLVFSGDDASAKNDVARLFQAIGFAMYDLGTLVEGGRLQQFPGGVFAAKNLIEVPA